MLSMATIFFKKVLFEMFHCVHAWISLYLTLSKTFSHPLCALLPVWGACSGVAQRESTVVGGGMLRGGPGTLEEAGQSPAGIPTLV